MKQCGKQVFDPVRPQNTAVNKRELREAIVKAFSLEELELLCTDVENDLADGGHELQVDLELVGGAGKAAKVMRLIDYLDRRGLLEYLSNAVRKTRPGIL